MRKITIRKFRAEDGTKLIGDPIEVAWKDKLDLQTFLNAERVGPCYSAFVDGQVIACAGLILLRTDVAEAWAVFSASNPFRLRGAILVRRMLKAIIRRRQLRYVFARIREDWGLGERFLRFMGFEDTGRKFPSIEPDGADDAIFILENQL